ncbi:MAG: methyltransferase domain-containing protein [Bacteroidetes bacterium]|nr:methyltransferase domain-containing protein [Bacteroidota bacterium]
MKLHQNIVDAILRSLHEIFEENKYADKVIERVLKSNPKWGGRDRRFIAETTYDIVRWYRLLHEITPEKERKLESIFGTYCEWKGFSDSDSIEEKIRSIQSIRKTRESIPDWMDELCIAELGEVKWEKEIHALNEQAKVVLRTNTLKISREELQKKLSAEEIETHTPENPSPDGGGWEGALVLSKRKNVFTSPSFKEGMFEVQDASSQLVAPFLDLKDGMRVIDACAGAGGKTLHISALMHNKGKVIALDTEQWKLDELKKRARRAGCSNIETRIIDSSKAIKRMENSADRLLLDVPCSGLGVLRRNPDAKWKLSLEFIEKVKILQQKILHDYSLMLKKGGMMVYSTCSILPSENEKQIEKFILEQNGAFELVEQKTIFPSEGFDGFFIARIKKK